MTKYTKYHVQLKGKPELVELLAGYIPGDVPSLGTARDLRRAIGTIFGDAVQLEIVAVKRLAANMRRL